MDHYLDHEIAEPFGRIMLDDNPLVVEACCVLTELMSATNRSFRTAVIQRWPQLAGRISDDPNSEIEKMPGAFRKIMALNIENSNMAEKNQDLWRIANILRNRIN